MMRLIKATQEVGIKFPKFIEQGRVDFLELTLIDSPRHEPKLGVSHIFFTGLAFIYSKFPMIFTGNIN